jgi:hypothetical protein
MQYRKSNSSMIEKMGTGALPGYIGASDVTEAEKSSNRVMGKSLLRETLAENKTSIEVTRPFQQKKKKYIYIYIKYIYIYIY